MLIISRLGKDCDNLWQWFKANYLKSNEDNCQLLLNIKNINPVELVAKVGDENIYKHS